MKPQPCLRRMFACLAAAGLALGWSGCGNILVPKHKVLVDAIAAVDAPKPSGMSYRLIAKRSMVNNVPVQVPVVKACIDAALVNAGMYEPPANVPPDLFIEVSFGADAGPRIDPASRETYLQLSARSNPTRALDKGSGPELWDVRVGVMGISGRMETAMPLLSTVAANYLATNTQMETKVEIPQNSPDVAAVRALAIKTLEGRSSGAPDPAQVPTTPASPAAAPAAAGTAAAPARRDT